MARHTNSYASSKLKKRTRRYTLEWTLDLSVALIQAVRRAEHLWDPSNTYYKDRNVKTDSWEKIAQAIGVSKPQAILRWSAMRGNYLAFLKKDKCCKGRCPDKKHRRFNPLYSEMKFLNPVIDPESKLCDPNVRKSPSPVNVSSTESEYCESNDYLQRSSTPKRQRTLSPQTARPQLSRSQVLRPQATQQREESPPEERTAMKGMMMGAYDLLMHNTQRNDEWDAFGNMIATNARSWSKVNMALARRYKAALSAVNAKFDVEVAEMSVGVEFVVN